MNLGDFYIFSGYTIENNHHDKWMNLVFDVNRLGGKMVRKSFEYMVIWSRYDSTKTSDKVSVTLDHLTDPEPIVYIG